ncbi:hypothetical protein PAMP_002483 [Pampus punctatissimus]
MNQRHKLMDPSESLFLRSTSTVSLNERFSQVLVNQLTQSRMVTFDPLQLKRVSDPPPGVFLVKQELPSSLALRALDSVPVKQRLKRRSVWSRLGRQQLTRCHRGFWSFRNKYRRRAGLSSTYMRRRNLRSRLGRRHLWKRTNILKPTGRQLHLNLQRGRATTSRGCGLSREKVPTKKQLDAQLDAYMSMSRSRLDEQLDDYMSMSRSRLDAELDEYMSMAGQAPLHWD